MEATIGASTLRIPAFDGVPTWPGFVDAASSQFAPAAEAPVPPAIKPPPPAATTPPTAAPPAINTASPPAESTLVAPPPASSSFIAEILAKLDAVSRQLGLATLAPLAAAAAPTPTLVASSSPTAPTSSSAFLLQQLMQSDSPSSPTASLKITATSAHAATPTACMAAPPPPVVTTATATTALLAAPAAISISSPASLLPPAADIAAQPPAEDQEATPPISSPTITEILAKVDSIGTCSGLWPPIRAAAQQGGHPRLLPVPPDAARRRPPRLSPSSGATRKQMCRPGSRQRRHIHRGRRHLCAPSSTMPHQMRPRRLRPPLPRPPPAAARSSARCRPPLADLRGLHPRPELLVAGLHTRPAPLAAGLRPHLLYASSSAVRRRPPLRLALQVAMGHVGLHRDLLGHACDGVLQSWAMIRWAWSMLRNFMGSCMSGRVLVVHALLWTSKHDWAGINWARSNNTWLGVLCLASGSSSGVGPCSRQALLCFIAPVSCLHWMSSISKDCTASVVRNIPARGRAVFEGW